MRVRECCVGVVVLLFMALASESSREGKELKMALETRRGCVGLKRKRHKQQQTGTEEALNARDESF